jgi:hypothetical protein
VAPENSPQARGDCHALPNTKPAPPWRCDPSIRSTLDPNSDHAGVLHRRRLCGAVKSDLQNTADAAALAGAEKLQQLYVLYNMPGQPSQAQILAAATTNSSPSSPMATAERFANLNRAGNVNITLLEQDINFGLTDAQGNYTSPYSGFPNTIEVTVRRDDTANGRVGLFVGGVLGMSNVSLVFDSAFLQIPSS